MTLDIQKWFTQSIKTQQKISHNYLKFFVEKSDKISEDLRRDIQKQFGESYLLDAQYVLFFKKADGDFTDKEIKQVFELVNTALGKGANNSTQNDFKKFTRSENIDEVEDPEVDDVQEEPEIEDHEEDVEEPINNEPSIGYIFAKITLK